LDLGGTNFRVIFLRIKAGKLESEEVQVNFKSKQMLEQKQLLY
jgi:hypothetical protein